MTNRSKNKVEQSSHITDSMTKKSVHGVGTRGDKQATFRGWVLWSFLVDIVLIIEGSLIKSLPLPSADYGFFVTIALLLTIFFLFLVEKQWEKKVSATQKGIVAFATKYPWLVLLVIFPLLVFEVLSKLGAVKLETIVISVIAAVIAVWSIYRELKKIIVHQKNTPANIPSFTKTIWEAALWTPRICSLAMIGFFATTDIGAPTSIAIILICAFLYAQMLERFSSKPVTFSEFP